MYIEKSSNKNYRVVERIYAHRTISQLLVTEVEIEVLSKTAPSITLLTKLNKWSASYDMTFTSEESDLEEARFVFNPLKYLCRICALSNLQPL